MSGGRETAQRGVRFAGYAALFGREDRGGDIIRPGAFAASLRAWRTKGAIPLLWQHRPDQRIGSIDHVEEDTRGLRVIGRLMPEAGEAAAALKGGRVNGLSFGYRATAARGERPRLLDALEIIEVSLVTHPMQPLARVHAVEG